MDDVQALKELMTTEFRLLREQRDEDRVVSSQRHTENVSRLVAIEVEVRATNGRVTRHDEQIKTLFGRSASSTGVEGVTLDRLKWYLACTGGGFGAAIGILKLMGKL